ncbi:MAG: KOW domain-containing RNA-binding protein [Defluviitaleaceae bacterium]|nr:KOW domain-containing RNA-binding protein [Defluviitaleaceae bacterium]MCL2273617.1 KOW domain-containing RNA-binding protein [Defluviitaleaceae bacterium]
MISKKGRDKGRYMIVLSVEPDKQTNAIWLTLVDGYTRTLSKPKKKKAMHVQPTNCNVDLTSVGPRGLQDADIRKMLGEEVSPLGKR